MNKTSSSLRKIAVSLTGAFSQSRINPNVIEYNHLSYEIGRLHEIRNEKFDLSAFNDFTDGHSVHNARLIKDALAAGVHFNSDYNDLIIRAFVSQLSNKSLNDFASLEKAIGRESND